MYQSKKYITGIGFWIGATVFTLIDIFKIFTNANILHYDYIMTGVAVFFILLSLILVRNKNKANNGNTIAKYKYGIGFWIGGGIYSLINMIMNLKNAPQSNILAYNYLIIGIAVIGLILNLILLRKEKNKDEKSKPNRF